MQEREPLSAQDISEPVLEEARQFVHQLITLLSVEPAFDSAFEVANRVCDRHGIGRAA
jgi:hypothetical protein